MSKYLITMAGAGFDKFTTKIYEFKGERPTEGEIKEVAGFSRSIFGEYFFPNRILFMQKLEDEDE